MGETRSQNPGALPRQWLEATAIGWLLGLVLVVGIGLLWEVAGGQAQFMVGVGMGAGVGVLQHRVLRHVIHRPRGWIWTSTVGMGAPFVLWDLSAVVGSDLGLSLLSCVLIGGVLTGLGQWAVLRRHSPQAGWWLPAVALGWAVPVFAIHLGDFAPPPWGEFSSLAGMFLGGAMLGAVTGGPLSWILAAPARPPAAPQTDRG